ncbi:glycerol-3-phosphate 1-O-acyltransferase PlsY [Ammonifex thiophilus]|uniref:Glycerol-3-phosphate acyltransferase n=1 Tax=Ammonifex thiophilus TaxID=444093 RepID=A0A3D8P6M0_9THEO|nr:glycerol-3-phosphate 1-O-acyltransferase PlsY [Ammonifex thiophilus]RDV84004.1 glycerol-3-phosphate 1-O-acyltransferase [Ammonifex thiophilus]
MLKLLGFALLAYLIGSFPTGYLLARLKGVNIFERGSGNIGATNVWRTLGPFYGTLAFIGDAGKGALAAYLGMCLGPTAAVLTGAAALVGHAFSVFLRFRGGKMVATALGVFLLLAPKATLGALAVWIFVFALGRYVSLASIIAAGSLPILASAFRYPRSICIFSLLTAVVVILRHRDNIRRLLEGREHRFGR